VAVVNSRQIPCSPCGACRQVMAEFGPDAAVFYQGPGGIKQLDMRTLLPDCFVME
jgi:cytidine deaminase